jgi:hypothetical protein
MYRSMMTALLLGIAAPSLAAPRPLPGPHGPPDIPNIYVCKVLPRDGGGHCTTTPYPHLGAPCTCEGGRGPRHGVVVTR